MILNTDDHDTMMDVMTMMTKTMVYGHQRSRERESRNLKVSVTDLPTNTGLVLEMLTQSKDCM